MKRAIFIVLIAIFVDQCQPVDQPPPDPYVKKESKKSTTPAPPERVNVSYGNFDIPPKLLLQTFRNIMEKISNYKRGVYCPFMNQQECGIGDTLNRAITQIIADEVKNSDDPELQLLKGTILKPKKYPKQRLKIFAGRSFKPVKKNVLNLKLYMADIVT